MRYILKFKYFKYFLSIIFYCSYKRNIIISIMIMQSLFVFKEKIFMIYIYIYLSIYLFLIRKINYKFFVEF